MSDKKEINKQHRIRVGGKVRKIRNMMGLTQERMAEIMGYSNSGMVAQVESGERGMMHDKIKSLAEYANIDPYYITNGEDYTVDELRLLAKFSKVVKEGDKNPLFNAFRKMLDD